MNELIKLLRVHQWIKNLFVFLPVFFAGELLNGHATFFSFLGFLLFSLTASLVYVINDYGDIQEDRLHPEKCKRPLASGAIAIGQARWIIVSLFLLVVGLSTLIFFLLPKGNNWQAIFIVFAYLLMNLAYSYKLKKIALLDITIIAIGFLMRVLVGGYMTGIVVSKWAILLVFMLAFIMAVGKRRGELLNAEVKGVTRKSLEGYNLDFLNTALGLVSGLTVMCYILFTFSEDIQEKFHQTVYLTVIFVLVGILRYLQQSMVYNRTESPTKLAYKDRFLQLVIVLWTLTFGLMIYFKGTSLSEIFSNL